MNLFKKYSNCMGLMSMMLPVMLFLIIFSYVPIFGGLVAFKDYVLSEGIIASKWIGFDNFAILFESEDFPKAIRNTLTISILRLTFGFFAPIVLALLLNEIRKMAYKRVIQTMTYLPHFFSWVILGGIFLMLLNGSGPINSIIQNFTDSPIPFLTNDVWFIIVLIATGIWQAAGWGAIIYIAALSGISSDLYEAAEIDGANRWQQTLSITLPCLVPTMITMFILSLGGIMTAGFDQIYNLYNPMVYDVADIVDTFVLRKMMGLDISLAASADLFKSLVGLILVVSSNTIAKKISGGEQGVW